MPKAQNPEHRAHDRIDRTGASAAGTVAALRRPKTVALARATCLASNDRIAAKAAGWIDRPRSLEMCRPTARPAATRQTLQRGRASPPTRAPGPAKIVRPNLATPPAGPALRGRREGSSHT